MILQGDTTQNGGPGLGQGAAAGAVTGLGAPAGAGSEAALITPEQQTKAMAMWWATQ